MNTPAREPRRAFPRLRLGLGAGVLVAVGAFAAVELHGSFMQSQVLSRHAEDLHATPLPGPSPSIRYPADGSMDRRYGYTRLPEFIRQLDARGWSIAAQARQTAPLAEFIEAGYHPPYAEKAQAGLRLLDCTGRALQTLRHPHDAYEDFDAIPPLVGRTLLFIEDRELLSPARPTSNPAVEPMRLVRALAAEAVGRVDRHAPDGLRSTLAVRAERHRHGPEGRTVTMADRWRHVVSASMRAYSGGEKTVEARRRIVVDYLNSLPLGRLAGRGEVYGLGDGLAAWYGADFVTINAALRAAAGDARYSLRERGRGYRQVLSLLIAQRQPAYYLGPGQGRLARVADRYLHLLEREGIIDEALRDAALDAWMPVHEVHAPAGAAASLEASAGAPARLALAALLGAPRSADVERLDLDATTTLDAGLQSTVTHALRRLREPGVAQAAGLVGPRRIEQGDPRHVRYTFTLVERGADGADRVRVLADGAGDTVEGDAAAELAAVQPLHADLMGVIVNAGWRVPPMLFERLRFAARTPYETTLTLQRRSAEQVMPPEDAAALARAMASELAQADSKGLRDAYAPLPAGGQTTRDGTRSVSFVFFLGDRHHGSLTAHLAPGASADDVRFGADVPAHVLRHLAPLLRPILNGAAACPAAERTAPVPAGGLRVDSPPRTRVSEVRSAGRRTPG